LQRPTVVGDEAVLGAELAALETLRPRTRADCVGGPRPCPWVSCIHHLALRVQPNGTIMLNSGPGYRGSGAGRALNPRKVAGGAAEVSRLIALAVELVEALPHTCALDVADEGEHNFVQIAELLGIDKERARQIAEGALSRGRAHRVWQDEPLGGD
jgi:hypothetical protein